MDKSRILIVEDENIVAMELHQRLIGLGYEVVGQAATGLKAIENAENLNPDLILMDIMLKGEMDGIEASEIIHSKSDIPIIFLTANADENTLNRAKVTDPYGYILKPFEVKELHTSIEIAIYKSKAERKLKEREQWLSTTLRSIGDAVITTDKEGLVTFMNPIAENMTGWKQEEALGKELTKVFNIISEVTRKKAEIPVYKVLENGKIVGLANHTAIISKDGTERPIMDSAAPIKSADGIIDGVVLVFQDMSDRKQAEEKINMQSAALESAANGIAITNKNGKFIWVNSAFSKLTGYSNEELVGKTPRILKSGKQDNEFYKNLWDTILSGQVWQGELINKRKDGSLYYEETTITPVKNENDEIAQFVSIKQDISNRKKMEKEIKDSEEQFRGLYENATVGIYQNTPDGEILMANPTLIKMMGYNSFEEMKEVLDVADGYVDHSSRNRFISIIEEKGFIKGFESAWNKPDGSIIYVYESARVVKDSDGNVLYYEGMVEDVTQLKLIQKNLLKAKEKAEKSDRLKSEFLAGVSHEIRTPVNTILSFVSLLKDQIDENSIEDYDDIFSTINNGSGRLIRTIDSILNMSQLQAGSFEVNKENFDIVDDTLNSIYIEFKQVAESKSLKLNLNKNGIKNSVNADKYTVFQLFSNLIDNSIKYTTKGEININIFSKSKSKLCVEIEDTGIGMSEDFLETLFEPFMQEEQGYTRRFEGNGLGLALVKKYCELNNALIEVQSKKNEGTKFSVIFEKPIDYDCDNLKTTHSMNTKSLFSSFNLF